MAVTVQKVVDNVGKLLERMAELTGSDVLVGIPAAKGGRKDSKEPTNAELGRIHEFGSPAQNIPARPFLFPAVRAIQPEAKAMFAKGAQDVLTGKGTVDVTLHKIGMLARNRAVQEITEPTPPFTPLKPATIRARMRKTAAGRRKLKKLNQTGGFAAYAYATDPVTGQYTNVKPLIDSGQLRAALSYVVRKGGA